MKIKNYIAAAILLLTGSAASAQVRTEDYMAFLSDIADRSPQLNAADKSYEATRRNLRLGLAPDDPTVNLEYNFGADKSTYDIAFQQQFDFPTLYHQRNKISKLGISRAEQDFMASRRVIMNEISDHYLTFAYQSELIELLNRRKNGLEQVIDLYEKGIEVGQTTILDLESARMMLIGLEQDLAFAKAALNEANANLELFNAGQPLDLHPKGYPDFIFSGTRDEFIEAALALDPELQAVALDTLIAQREMKLSRQEWLPKFNVGYKADIQDGKTNNVLLAGISIPLWQNSGRTKYAKANRQAAYAQHETTQKSVKTRLGSLYDRYYMLLPVANSPEMQTILDEYPKLLRESAEAGVIGSIKLLLTLDEWYTQLESQLNIQYEAAMAGALMSICLM